MKKKNDQQRRKANRMTLVDVWKRHIMAEKNCTEDVAEKKALKMKSLVEYMQWGRAVISYYMRDGEYKMVIGTLVPYNWYFHKSFDINKMSTSFVYWNEDVRGWRIFQIENLIEWRAIV